MAMKLEFSKVLTTRGSRMREINVSRNGRPFGKMWTWPNTRTEWHPWHAQPLNGEHKVFYNKNETGGDLKAAMAYMESHSW